MSGLLANGTAVVRAASGKGQRSKAAAQRTQDRARKQAGRDSRSTEREQR